MIPKLEEFLSAHSKILSNENQNVELEIRLGKFKQNQFIPGIPKITFDKILKSFDDWNQTNIDETIFKNILEKQRKNIGWILKDNIQKYDDKNENIRIALNLETKYSFADILKKYNTNQTTFSKDKIQLFRKKNRFSRIFDLWQLDMTIVDVFVIENNNWKKTNTIYECEIELIKYTDKKEILKSFENVWNFLSPFHYGAMIFPEYYSLVKSNRFIGNQPKTLERKHMHLLSKGYMVTDKADGQRMFLFSSKRGLFLIDNLLNVRKYNQDIQIPYGTLIDGEYINKNNAFFAFDCLFYKYEDVKSKNLLERLNFLKKVKNLKLKQFLEIEKSKDLFQNTKFPYALDGLIFTPKDADYYGDIFKWKSQHTMDVFVDENFELYTYSSKEKGNILISSFFKPTEIVKNLDIIPTFEPNQIVELEYDSIDDVWFKKSYRKDKAKPNAILTIKGIIKAITENITIDDILNSLESNYKTPGKTIKERSEKIDIQYRNFHNKVKTYLIEYPPKEERKLLLDLGSGKGGDIMKWIKAGYTDVLAIDNSHTHLYGPNGFQERYQKVKDKINITFVWGDVTKPLKTCGYNDEENEKIKSWYDKKFNVISCQFAIHYFLNDKETWSVFMKNIQKSIKKGGYFIGTFLNSHNLEKLNNNHEFKINSNVFYTLKHNNPKYKELKQKNKYLAFWKLPRDKLSIQTTEWDNEIEENVLFPEFLDILVEKYKFKMIENKSFQTLIDELKPKLHSDEKLLSSLHNYFIYQQDS